MSSAEAFDTDRKVFTRLDSTNAEGLRLGADLTAPTWLLALEQTAARGRRGRPWVNPAGNFAASLVMRPPEPVARWALRSFAAALALDEALQTLGVPAPALSLKWPNDVLLNGGKLAGILLETAGPVLVIGIGVNLAAAPVPDELEPGAVPPVALGPKTGVTVTPEALLDALAPAYAGWEGRLRSFGFAPLRSAWLARAARLGETIRARTGTAEHTGTFRTVDPEGNLVLETAAGPRAIPAAEIFF